MRFLKPYNIPPGFVLVIDTREQLPLFKDVPGLVTQVKKLDHGDYSVAGYEDRFCIERKRISDLTSYITSERKKTLRKLEAMKHLDWKALVIECEEIELYLPKQFTKTVPEAYRQTLVSWHLRYNLHTYCSGNRADIERYILDHAIKFYRIMTEDQHEVSK